MKYEFQASMLTLDAYQHLIVATLPSYQEKAELRRHLALGLVCSLNHLPSYSERFKEQEQLGDALWHLSQLLSSYEIALEEMADVTLPRSEEEILSLRPAYFAEMLRKMAIEIGQMVLKFGNSRSWMFSAARRFWSYLKAYLLHCCLTLFDIMAENLNCLLSAEHFSPNHAYYHGVYRYIGRLLTYDELQNLLVHQKHES